MQDDRRVRSATGIAAAVTLLETTRRRLSLVYIQEAECWDRTTYLCIDPTPVIERSKPAAKIRKSPRPTLSITAIHSIEPTLKGGPQARGSMKQKVSGNDRNIVQCREGDNVLRSVNLWSVYHCPCWAESKNRHVGTISRGIWLGHKAYSIPKIADSITAFCLFEDRALVARSKALLLRKSCRRRSHRVNVHRNCYSPNTHKVGSTPAFAQTVWQWIVNPPRAGSIPVVRPSINGPFVSETEDKPRKLFLCKSSRVFQTHPSNWYPIQFRYWVGFTSR
ncbi:hypothetical protein RND71_022028 [Anisodus tanguticus]|uniref:Uncharacterized protein n=1 Tax=Anisodus tanguticus TaxID=243964 RepID=A0AAE1VFT9_9SOLA|nr:hypothetical protein RND71_022028 [Anisodus tanguticus]